MDIAIMGTQRSGKSSIKKVVFQKMSPHESVFIDSTTQIETFQIDNLGNCKFNITEFPYNFLNIEKLQSIENNYLQNCGTLIFVFDSQEASNLPFEYFNQNIIPLLTKHSFPLSIFIHKTDSVNLGQTELEKQIGEIKSKFNQIIKNNLEVKYYITSIYDYSLYETFSKIFQTTMPQNKNVSKLLDNLTECCKFEKCYLFDVFYKIYIGVDFVPYEEQIYELCSDMIDVALDMSGIYGDENNNDSYFDDNSNSMIKIDKFAYGKKNILYLRFIDANLVLISMINEKDFYRPHLLDYNIKLFIQSVKMILQPN